MRTWHDVPPLVWWVLGAAIVVVIIAAVIGWLLSVSASRRRATVSIVQGSTHVMRPNDDAWRSVHVLRVPRHVWLWVPVETATGLTTGAVDAGDAADRIAMLWHGTAVAVPHHGMRFYRFHIRRGGH